MATTLLFAIMISLYGLFRVLYIKQPKENNQQSYDTQLGRLIPSSTPTATIPLTLNLNGDIHVSFAQKIDGPLADILEICSSRSKHVDYSQNMWVVILMVVVVVVAMVINAVAMVMVMIITMAMTVAMPVAVIMIMMIIGSYAGIVQPEFGNRIPHDTP